MKNSLVTVDGSEASLRALQAALDLVPSDARIHVVTVQAPILSGNVQRFIPASEIDAYYQAEGEKALKEARERVEQAGRQAYFEVLVGQIAPTIADYISRNNIDHLFMGTRGLGGVSGLVLGSVTTRVLTQVEIPVTLIR